MKDILIDKNGHIKLADFGSALILSDPIISDSNNFVGSQDYVSPEVLLGRDVSKSCDLWAVGCIFYQMITGFSPFRAETEYLTFQNILGFVKEEFSLPNSDKFTPESRDLVYRFLCKEEDGRLGAGEIGSHNDYDGLKMHSYFHGVDWATLASRKAPFLPNPEVYSDCGTLMDGAEDDWLFETDALPITAINL